MFTTGRTLYKKIFNTFKSLTDCTSLLCCLHDLCAMAVSKPIQFEELISITSCNDILFYFLHENNVLFNFIVFAHVVATVCVIFIGNFNIYHRRTNNHLRNALLLLRPSNDKCPHLILNITHILIFASNKSFAAVNTASIASKMTIAAVN